MKVVFGEREVRAFSRFRIKPLAASLILIKPINVVMHAVSRYLLPAAIRHRLPLNRPFVEYRPLSGRNIRLLRPDRDLVARDIHWGNGKPTSAADALVLHILERLCRDAATFVDVGTYAGLFALIAARANDDLEAIAYDIVPENYLLTLSNVVANDLVGRIECRLSGLGIKPDEIRVPTALGLSSNATSVSLGSGFSEGTRIPVTTLDDESSQWRGPIVMKIDVEGFEVAVLQGAHALLAAHTPDMICEVLPGDDADVRALEALLRPYGYRFYHPTGRGISELESISPSWDARDWVFSTRDLANILPVAVHSR